MQAVKVGLDAAFVERQRQHLLRLRANLLAAARAAESDEADVRGKSTREAVEFEDDAQRLDTLERDGHLVVRDVQRLERVDRALKKIEEGTYGLSDISGQPIPRERLEAIPEALYTLSEEDKARPWIEVSGRKGFGVKADDLLDALIASAGKEVDSRHPELSAAERGEIATQIAIGALRYFMLKFTKPSVIAFDFKDALSFEGDTGPYAQYAVVRASNIFRKGGIDPARFCRDASGGGSATPDSAGAGGDGASPVSTAEFGKFLGGEAGNEIWELWLVAAQTSYVVAQCIATTEPAYLAKHAFRLAQLFSVFYHRHPILSEADEDRKKFLLSTVAVVRRELIRVLAAMGIRVPAAM